MTEGRTGAFRRFVDERMAAQGISSLVELAETSDVAYDTLHAWFRGRIPTPKTGARVARTLGVTYRELLDAAEGIEIGEADTDLASAIRDQTRAINELVDALRPMAGPLAQQVADLQWAVGRLFEQAGLGSPKPPARRQKVE